MALWEPARRSPLVISQGSSGRCAVGPVRWAGAWTGAARLQVVTPAAHRGQAAAAITYDIPTDKVGTSLQL
jgi:hypothetical protein